MADTERMLEAVVWSAVEACRVPVNVYGLYTYLLVEEGLEFVDRHIGSQEGLIEVLDALAAQDRLIKFRPGWAGPSMAEYSVVHAIPTVRDARPYGTSSSS